MRICQIEDRVHHVTGRGAVCASSSGSPRSPPYSTISRSYLITFEIIVRNNQYSPNYRTHRTPGCRDLGNNKNKMKLFGTLDTCMMGTNTLLFSGSSHRFEVPNQTVCARALHAHTPDRGSGVPTQIVGHQKKNHRLLPLRTLELRTF